MNKAQGLPISTVVLVIIAVAVAALAIMYILTSGGKGFDVTQTFWGLGGNMTKNASAEAGKQTDVGPTETCSKMGKTCDDKLDCCDTSMLCRKKNPDSATKTCEYCATTGEYCRLSEDCCSSSCDNSSIPSYCS